MSDDVHNAPSHAENRSLMSGEKVNLLNIAKRTLYVVATPLGNLRDLTLRAKDILQSVDLILAEDTRVTAKLLSAYKISTPTRALHRHNERAAAAFVIAALNEGKSLALVSDAGTPAVSDPGAKLVNDVREAGFSVAPIPGASALTAALSGAGLHSEHFYFAGFLPREKKARATLLEKLRPLSCALIFYEAPHRVKATVADLARFFSGDRQLTIARELTKTFETFARLPLATAFDWIEARPETERGEIVLLLDNTEKTDHAPTLDATVTKWLQALIDELPPARAARVAAAVTGISRDLLYQEAMRLKTLKGDAPS